jgi:hypothetical protein
VRGAGFGSGASRPSAITWRGAVLRAPVMRVPSVGHQRSMPDADLDVVGLAPSRPWPP